ncbi:MULTISPECIES: hypothetical protein [Mucilaginibacter]|uniref:hypothetical protein n=1 Tax=Mucilaginibacter TaxID=423349 RepID=UPI000871A1C7|nr:MULTISPECIES: hypothetical protein [Mucilaginibacter]GGB01814.1 hypothetical protein GCM10011500_17050 [Mucilaginibacter rubeus]SCW55858.1 hypothetical protein SAMN03159284_01847 [Mucilaginibacter sp. NFR10]
MKTTTVKAYGTEAADASIHDSNLKSAGILPTDSVEKASYGNFVHLMDPRATKLNYGNLMMWNMPNWVN